jgi:hypothetical protein
MRPWQSMPVRRRATSRIPRVAWTSRSKQNDTKRLSKGFKATGPAPRLSIDPYRRSSSSDGLAGSDPRPSSRAAPPRTEASSAGALRERAAASTVIPENTELGGSRDRPSALQVETASGDRPVPRKAGQSNQSRPSPTCTGRNTRRGRAPGSFGLIVGELRSGGATCLDEQIHERRHRSLRLQCRCSSQNSCSALVIHPPAHSMRRSAASCAATEVPPTASTTT